MSEVAQLSRFLWSSGGRTTGSVLALILATGSVHKKKICSICLDSNLWWVQSPFCLWMSLVNKVRPALIFEVVGIA